MWCSIFQWNHLQKFTLFENSLMLLANQPVLLTKTTFRHFKLWKLHCKDIEVCFPVRRHNHIKDDVPILSIPRPNSSDINRFQDNQVFDHTVTLMDALSEDNEVWVLFVDLRVSHLWPICENWNSVVPKKKLDAYSPFVGTLVLPKLDFGYK